MLREFLGWGWEGGDFVHVFSVSAINLGSALDCLVNVGLEGGAEASGSDAGAGAAEGAADAVGAADAGAGAADGAVDAVP